LHYRSGPACGGVYQVDRLHSLSGQRAGVLDGLLTDLAKAWVDGWIVDIGGLASDHTARTELGAEFGVLWIIGVLGFFFGIEVIEIAEEFVEAMHGWQIFVAVAKVVFAELTGGIAERLERFSDGYVFWLQSHRGARYADLGQASPDNRLPGDER